MKLTTGQIHDLYGALTQLDRDETIKLTPEVRLKVAIDWNALRPIGEAYERVRARTLATLLADNRKLTEPERRSDQEIEADFADKNDELRAVQQDVELRTFTRPDLRLDENQKIGGTLLARLWPVLDGFEVGS